MLMGREASALSATIDTFEPVARPLSAGGPPEEVGSLSLVPLNQRRRLDLEEVDGAMLCASALSSFSCSFCFSRACVSPEMVSSEAFLVA